MTTTHLKKRIKLPLSDVMRFHILVEVSLLRNGSLITSDLDLLTLLTQGGRQSLPAFCLAAARHLNPECSESQLGTRAQNIRNRLVKLEKRGLVLKSRPGNKTLIEPAAYLAVDLDKPILLDYQFLSKYDPQQAE